MIVSSSKPRLPCKIGCALSRKWPLGLHSGSCWAIVGLSLALLYAALRDDEFISSTLRTLIAPVHSVMAVVSDYGLSDWILIPTLALFALAMIARRLCSRKSTKLALGEIAALNAYIFIGVGLPGLLANLIKRGVGRVRPDMYADYGAYSMRSVLNDWTFQSFPSGHTTTAFAFAFIIGFLVPRLFLPLLLVAFAVGLSRIALGMHYPSDVFGGMLLGMFGAYMVRNGFAARGWLFHHAADGSMSPIGFPNLARLLDCRQRASRCRFNPATRSFLRSFIPSNPM